MQGKAGRKASTEGKMDRRKFPGRHTGVGGEGMSEKVPKWPWLM